MIIDNELVFSNDQSIAHAAGSFDSSVVVDAIADGGVYDNVWLFIKISTTVVGSGAYVEFALHTSNDGFSSDNDVLFSTEPIGVADLTANAVIARVRVPLGLKQDIKLIYTVSGATTTAGTVYAAFVPDVSEGF